MSLTDLLPCRCCGDTNPGHARFGVFPELGTESLGPHTRCEACGAMSKAESDTYASYLAAWNRRPASDAAGFAYPANGADGNRPILIDRDRLGHMVRSAWTRWAATQPDADPSWLTSYEDLPENEREGARQIGEFIARWTLIADAAGSSRDTEPDLHPDTRDLLDRFSAALAAKLAAAERKYGYSNHWKSPDWMDQCREQLLAHVYKGDPRDVAAYAAFLWHHREPTHRAPG